MQPLSPRKLYSKAVLPTHQLAVPIATVAALVRYSRRVGAL